jgi:hypothetical protein
MLTEDAAEVFMVSAFSEDWSRNNMEGDAVLEENLYQLMVLFRISKEVEVSTEGDPPVKDIDIKDVDLLVDPKKVYPGSGFQPTLILLEILFGFMVDSGNLHLDIRMMDELGEFDVETSAHGNSFQRRLSWLVLDWRVYTRSPLRPSYLDTPRRRVGNGYWRMNWIGVKGPQA